MASTSHNISSSESEDESVDFKSIFNMECSTKSSKGLLPKTKTNNETLTITRLDADEEDEDEEDTEDEDADDSEEESLDVDSDEEEKSQNLNIQNDEDTEDIDVAILSKIKKRYQNVDDYNDDDSIQYNQAIKKMRLEEDQPKAKKIRKRMSAQTFGRIPLINVLREGSDDLPDYLKITSSKDFSKLLYCQLENYILRTPIIQSNFPSTKLPKIEMPKCTKPEKCKHEFVGEKEQLRSNDEAYTSITYCIHCGYVITKS